MIIKLYFNLFLFLPVLSIRGIYNVTQLTNNIQIRGTKQIVQRNDYPSLTQNFSSQTEFKTA